MDKIERSGSKAGVGVTIDAKLLAKAREEAEKANRTFSNYVEGVLRRHLNGQDLKKIAEKIYQLFHNTDFPEVLDIKNILEEELER